MNAQAILSTIEPGKDFAIVSDFIPYDAPNFSRLESLLNALLTLDHQFKRTATGWHKLTHKEHIASRRAHLECKFHLLMTDPAALNA